MKVLVAVGSPQTAKETVDYVMEFARKLKADVYALHVKAPFDGPSHEDSLTVFAEAGLKNGVKVHRLFWKGDIISSIILAAKKEKVDMILMGASESANAGNWACASVMKQSSVPVVVLPQHRIQAIKAA